MFSKYLQQYWHSKTLHETLECMRSVKDDFTYKYCVLKNHHILTDSPLTMNEYFLEGNYIYTCITNRHLMKIVEWINENIILTIDTDFYKSTDVKIRIATGMINKLVGQGKLDKDYGLIAHDILIANIVSIQNELSLEELPF